MTRRVVAGAEEAAVGGVRKFVKGVEEIKSANLTVDDLMLLSNPVTAIQVGHDKSLKFLRGMTDISLGTVSTGFVAAFPALIPFSGAIAAVEEPLVGNVREAFGGEGKGDDEAEWARIGLSVVSALALPHGAAMAIATAGSIGGAKAVEHLLDTSEWAKGLEEEDRERILEGAGHVGFFAGLGAVHGVRSAVEGAKSKLASQAGDLQRDVAYGEGLTVEGPPLEDVRAIDRMRSDLEGRPKVEPQSNVRMRLNPETGEWDIVEVPWERGGPAEVAGQKPSTEPSVLVDKSGRPIPSQGEIRPESATPLVDARGEPIPDPTLKAAHAPLKEGERAPFPTEVTGGIETAPPAGSGPRPRATQVRFREADFKKFSDDQLEADLKTIEGTPEYPDGFVGTAEYSGPSHGKGGEITFRSYKIIENKPDGTPQPWSDGDIVVKPGDSFKAKYDALVKRFAVAEAKKAEKPTNGEQAPPAKAEAAPSKQLWEMTKEEYEHHIALPKFDEARLFNQIMATGDLKVSPSEKTGYEKLAEKISKGMDPEVLKALRVEEGEEWRVSPEAKEKLNELLRSAVERQEKEATGAKKAPDSELPSDLLFLGIASGPEARAGKEVAFQIHGFRPTLSGRARMYRRGVEVYADQSSYMLGERTVKVWKDMAAIRRDYDTYTYVPREDLQRRWEERPYWTANITGNSVRAESFFKDQGYENAFAGSPSAVDIRPATKTEIEAIGETWKDEWDAPTEKSHRQHVEEAFRSGKPVPENVLKEYPDLVKPPESAPAKAKPGEPIKFVKTEAGEQGVLLAGGQAKVPEGPKFRTTKGTEGTPLFAKEQKPSTQQDISWEEPISKTKPAPIGIDAVRRYRDLFPTMSGMGKIRPSWVLDAKTGKVKMADEYLVFDESHLDRTRPSADDVRAKGGRIEGDGDLMAQERGFPDFESFRKGYEADYDIFKKLRNDPVLAEEQYGVTSRPPKKPDGDLGLVPFALAIGARAVLNELPLSDDDKRKLKPLLDVLSIVGLGAVALTMRQTQFRNDVLAPLQKRLAAGEIGARKYATEMKARMEAALRSSESSEFSDIERSELLKSVSKPERVEKAAKKVEAIAEKAKKVAPLKPVEVPTIPKAVVPKAERPPAYKDVHGKIIEVFPTGKPNERGILLPEEFAKEASKLNDISMAQAGGLSLMDYLRVTEKVDGKRNGVVRRLVVDPIFKSNLARARELRSTYDEVRELLKTNKIRHKGVSLDPREGFAPPSESSIRIFRSLEGKLDGELTPQEKNVAQYFQRKYDEYLNRLNAVRETINLPPIARRQNYVTHFEELSAIGEMFGSLTDPRIPSELLRGIDFTKPNTPFFPYALQRKGGMFTEDAIGAFERYASKAITSIHFSIPVADARAYVKHLPGNAAKYFDHWLSEGVLGKSTAIDRAVPQWIKNPLKSIALRIGKNLILGNARVFITQLSSFPQTFAEAGVVNGLKGAIAALTPEGYGLAEKYSKILELRELEGLEDIHPSRWRTLEKMSAWHIEAADRFMVRMAWNAGLKKGLGEGMPFEEAVKYADDTAHKTQAAYGRMFKSPMLRNTVIGSTVGQFQQYSNNLMNYLVYDLLSRRGGESRMRVIGKAATLLGMAQAVNVIYDELGFQSPFTPSAYIPLWNAIVRLAIDDEDAALVGEGSGKFGTPAAIQTIRDLTLAPVKGLGRLASGDERAALREFEKTLKAAGRIVFPFGGSQVIKTIEGAFVVRDGVVRDARGKQLYRVEGMDEQLRTLLFGKYGSEAAKEYVEKMNEKYKLFYEKKAERTPPKPPQASKSPY